jgi:hypothetical protein
MSHDHTVGRYDRTAEKSNTEIEKRSSSPPIRSGKTPINHKKAMPANGTRFSARPTMFELVLSQAPASSGSARTARRNNKSPVIRRTAKRMPATAAARGVAKRARVEIVSCFMPPFYSSCGRRASLFVSKWMVYPRRDGRLFYRAVVAVGLFGWRFRHSVASSMGTSGGDSEVGATGLLYCCRSSVRVPRPRLVRAGPRAAHPKARPRLRRQRARVRKNLRRLLQSLRVRCWRCLEGSG